MLRDHRGALSGAAPQKHAVHGHRQLCCNAQVLARPGNSGLDRAVKRLDRHRLIKAGGDACLAEPLRHHRIAGMGENNDRDLRGPRIESEPQHQIIAAHVHHFLRSNHEYRRHDRGHFQGFGRGPGRTNLKFKALQQNGGVDQIVGVAVHHHHETVHFLVLALKVHRHLFAVALRAA